MVIIEGKVLSKKPFCSTAADGSKIQGEYIELETLEKKPHKCVVTRYFPKRKDGKEAMDWIKVGYQVTVTADVFSQWLKGGMPSTTIKAIRISKALSYKPFHMVGSTLKRPRTAKDDNRLSRAQIEEASIILGRPYKKLAKYNNVTEADIKKQQEEEKSRPKSKVDDDGFFNPLDF